VGGQAARYFDPRDLDAMIETLAAVAGNDDLRHEMSAQGLERARLFSWRRSALETAHLYQTLVPGIEVLV